MQNLLADLSATGDIPDQVLQPKKRTVNVSHRFQPNYSGIVEKVNNCINKKLNQSNAIQNLNGDLKGSPRSLHLLLW